MKSEKLKLILKGVWAFCSFVFVPQRRPGSEGRLMSDVRGLIYGSRNSLADKI